MKNTIPKTLIAGLCVAALWTISAPFARADAIPHGRDCVTAMEIPPGRDIEATLIGSDDRAVYRIALDQRGLLDVWTDAGNFDVWSVTLLDSSCREIPGVWAGYSVVTGKYVEISIPSRNSIMGDRVWTLGAGVYFIRLSPPPVGAPSRRAFTVHNRFTPHFGHDCKTAEPLSLVMVSASIDGALLYPEDREVFSVSTTSMGRIRVWITGPIAAPDRPVITLQMADCSSGSGLQVNDGTGSGIVTTPLDKGMYYLSIDPGRPNGLGSFTLHVEFVEDTKCDPWEDWMTSPRRLCTLIEKRIVSWRQRIGI